MRPRARRGLAALLVFLSPGGCPFFVKCVEVDHSDSPFRIADSHLLHTCPTSAAKKKDEWGSGAPKKVLEHAAIGETAGAGRPRNAGRAMSAAAAARGLLVGQYNRRTLVGSALKKALTAWDDYTCVLILQATT
jgi:hypothetical protein